MFPVYSVSEIRSAESALIAQLPPNELMHRAAFGLKVEVCDVLTAEFGQVSGLVGLGLIGVGNNGSDALWALALLAERGIRVYALKDSQRIADHTDELFTAAGGTFIGQDYLIARAAVFNFWLDGIAGLGSSRAVDSDWQAAVAVLNESAIGIAVDLPSGILPDSGELTESYLGADYTITFGGLKTGLVKSPAADICGEVRLIDIGLPLEAATKFYFTDADAHSLDQLPTVSSHKFNRGVVGVVAGSAEYPGAGMLAARAAIYGGAGAVVHYAEQTVADPLAASVIHKDLAGLSDLAKITAVVFGPGLSDVELRYAPAVLKVSVPVVLDAGAIDYCFKNHAELIKARKENNQLTILTPHAGELERLRAIRSTTEDLGELAKSTGCVIYRKGARAEIYAPDGEVGYVRRTSAFLATAGSGDVLAGLLGSLIAQNPTANPVRLVAAAVLRHSMLAEDLLRQSAVVNADSLSQVLMQEL